MIKEELEKEVEEYLENNLCKKVCPCGEIEECKQGIRIRCSSLRTKKELIVGFAESREKQIAHLEKSLIDVSEKSVKRIKELESTNKKISDECHKLVDTLERKQKRIAELEKSCDETQELLDRIAKLEKENESLENVKNIYIGDLLKAKKLISFWANDFYDNTSNPAKYEERHKALVESEQFLKEMEK